MDRKAKRAKANDVTLRLANCEPIHLTSSPVWVDKILDHLVENGTKSSKGGTVVLSAGLGTTL